MVLRQTAQKYFTTSMADFFQFNKRQENSDFVESLRVIKDAQIKIIEPLGWYSNCTYLESVGMIISEVYEIYSVASIGHQSIEERSIEAIDVLLRLFVLIDRLEKQIAHSQVSFEQFMYAENPVDNRLEALDTKLEKFKLEDWLFSLYNKLASSVNLIRGLEVTPDQQLDLLSCFSQVIYITFLMILKMNKIEPEEADTDDLELILKYFTTKLDINRTKLTQGQARYK